MSISYAQPVAPPNRPTSEVSRFNDGLELASKNLAASLPAHVSIEQFKRVALMAVQREPKLLGADRKALFLALNRAAADGLLPDGREGAIVLFGNVPQWMPMVAGLMKLARNSGEIASINAHIVYAGEKFRVLLGDEDRIEHERDISLPGVAKPIAVYAVAKLRSGELVREVMSWAEVMKVRNVSRAKNSGPWVDWEEEMGKKTAIKRLDKRLPHSTDRPGDIKLRAAIEDEVTTLNHQPVPAATPVGLIEAEPEQQPEVTQQQPPAANLADAPATLDAVADPNEPPPYDVPPEYGEPVDDGEPDIIADHDPTLALLIDDVKSCRNSGDLEGMQRNAAWQRKVERLNDEKREKLSAAINNAYKAFAAGAALAKKSGVR